jgi:hypothetical protein
MTTSAAAEEQDMPNTTCVCLGNLTDPVILSSKKPIGIFMGLRHFVH